MLGYSLLHNRLRFELTGFYFKLDNALVQRRDLSGADFFVNAGNSKQKGIEFHADYYLLFPAGKSSNQLVLRSDYTFSHFRYGNFIRGIDDYSGKTLPSVPTHTLSFLADLILKHGWYAVGTFPRLYFSFNIFSAPA